MKTMKKGKKQGAFSAKDFTKRANVYLKAFAKIGLLFTYFRIAYHEWLYKVHISVRKAHDNTYAQIKWYKNWTDKPYSTSVHRAVFASFVFSFLFFSVFQTMFPFFNKPQKALAGSHEVTWTTKGDFENNAVTTGTATTLTDTAVSGTEPGDDASISLAKEQPAWVATTTTNAPDARREHTAVWTGSKMIVWGGYNGSYLNTGSIYDPATDTWTAISTTGAPSGRRYHAAVWTGSKMIVWGGQTSSISVTNTGGVYDPATDTWTATSTTGAPTTRRHHSFVWTGSKMIVWGGEQTSTVFRNTGGIYDPETDTWTATSVTNVPTGRRLHSTVWTGSKMIIWGGYNGSYLGDGSLYDPVTDTWTATSVTDVPSARLGTMTVWTGSKMIVWGGYNGSELSTGGIYNPVTDTWTATSDVNAPIPRVYGEVVWNNSKMIVWGGLAGSSYLNTGAVYDPETDSWVATPTDNSPEGRAFSDSVWVGSKMIVWGGSNATGYLNTGGMINVTEKYNGRGSVSGIKIDAQEGVKARWTNLSWNTESLPQGTSIEVVGRTSNDNANWSAWGGGGNQNEQGTTYAEGSFIDLVTSRYLEIKVTLITGDGINTPVLNNLTVSFDNIETPSSTKTFELGGVTEVSDDDWTSSRSVIVKADVEGIAEEAITTQIAMAEGATAPVSDEEVLPEGVEATKSTVNYSGNPTVISQSELMSLSGLSHNKQYTYKIRYTDGAGRVSAWSTPKTFRTDFEGPVQGTLSINTGSEKTNQKAVILTVNFTDAETSVSQMRFSNDGSSWSEWEAYQSEKAWILSDGNGEKTVYAQAKDAVGNVSGKSWDSSSEFNSATYKEGVTVDGGSALLSSYKASTEGENKIAVNDRAAYFIDQNNDLWGAGKANALGINDSSSDIKSWQKLTLPGNKKAQKIFASDCGKGVYLITADNYLYYTGAISQLVTDYTWEPMLDNNSVHINDVKEFSAGYGHATMVRSDDKLWGFGNGFYLESQPTRFVRLDAISEDVTQVASACYGHSLILESSGVLKGISGSNEIGFSDWKTSWAAVPSPENGWDTNGGIKKIGVGSGGSYVIDNTNRVWGTTSEGPGTFGAQSGFSTWTDTGLTDVLKFRMFASVGTFAIFNDNSLKYADSYDMYTDYDNGLMGYQELDDDQYFDFAGGTEAGLSVKTNGEITAYGRVDYFGMSLSDPDPKVYPVSISGELGYLGNPEVAGTGFIVSGSTASKLAKLSPSYDSLSGGQALKYAYRTSNDGTNWSALKGRDGQAINWDTNYLGADGDISGGELFDDFPLAESAQYFEIVVRFEGGGSPVVLNRLEAEIASFDTIVLDISGPTVSFDPNKKYPAPDWNVKENVNSIEFRFATNEAAISYVDYGKESPSEAHGETSYGTNHHIVLKNLSPSTSYQYRLRVFDDLGSNTLLPYDFNNPALGYTATTTLTNTGFEGLPQVSSLSQVEITASTAKITWRTKNPTTSYIDFGTTVDYGSTAGDDDLNTNHVVELKNLTAGLVYHYRVRGNDASGEEYSSDDYTFKAIMNPEISNISVKEIGTESAVITWTTNVKTDSAVNFGTGLPFTNREYSSEMLNNHSLKIDKLEENKLYRFQVEVKDEYSNATKSAERTFSTLPDTEGPKIEDVKIDIMPIESDTAAAQVIVSWKTSEPATAKIEYGEGIVGGKYEKSTIEDTSLNFTHTSIIKELAPNMAYHFRITSADRKGNETKSIDYNLVTPAKQKSIWQLILKTIEETFSWTRNVGGFLRGVVNKAK